MSSLRTSPSGKRIVATQSDDALVWNEAARTWIPSAILRYAPGAPIYDVTKPPYNALGLSLAPDDTNAIASAILAANARPGVVYLGNWHRVTAALPPILNNNVIFAGRGRFNGGTVFQVDAPTSQNVLQVVGCRDAGVIDLWVSSTRLFTDNWAVRFSGTTRGFARNLLISRIGGGIEIERCTLTDFARINVGDIYGPHGFYAHGSSGVFNHAVKFRDCLGGQSYPLAITGTSRPWAQNTNYALGNVVTANGNLYQCAVAGLSSAVGSGPSGLPGTNPDNVHSALITDGTVQWRFAMSACAWFRQGSFSHTFEVLDCGTLQGAYGLSVEDDVPASDSEPQFCRTQNLQIDHPATRGIRILSGVSHRNHMTWVSSVFGGSGIEVGVAVGNWEFQGGEVYGCADAGILISGGFGRVHGIDIGSVSASLSNSRDCIEVAPGTTDFTVEGCTLDGMKDGPIRSRYGISIGAGADRYVVANNRCTSNLTAGILNTPGTSSTRVVASNIGTIV